MVTRIGFAFVAVLTLFMNFCPPKTTEPISSPQETYKFYIKNHWIPLPEPDSRFEPGAVFTFTPDTGFRWVGDLATCGFPKDVITPNQGESGKLTFNGGSDYGASAVLQIKGISMGPEFSKVKSTKLELDQHGPSSLNLFNVRLWLNDPANAGKVPQLCKDMLNEPNTYIVQEAYSVSKGKYTLQDKMNAKIAVKGLQLGPVSIAPDVHVTPTADGSLEFNTLLYTAIRRVEYASGGWKSLGKKDQPDVDQKILSQLPYVEK